MKLVLALDPGRTTGYALAIGEPELHIAYGETRFNNIELYDWLHHIKPAYIICESFDYRRLKDADLYPCELIGVMNLFRQQEDVPTYMQKPSIQGKDAYWTDGKLKELEIYKAGTEHGRSALKHLLYWLIFGHGAQFELLKPGSEKIQFTGVSWFIETYTGRG